MFRTFISSVLILTVGTLTAFGGHPKVARDLDNVNPESTVDVIIQYRHAPTAAHHQKVHDKGGQHKRDLSLIKGAHYSVPADKLRELADDPDVVAISPDREVQGALDLTAAAVNAGTAANYKLDGTGIGVAVIDSGVNPHPDLIDPGPSRIVYSQDFTGEGLIYDPYGHGTHVAGALAGNAYVSALPGYTFRTFRGIAPNANIINLRVLNSQGTMSRT